MSSLFRSRLYLRGRRRMLRLVMAALLPSCLLLTAPSARAQDADRYPSHPVRIVVGFPAGGSSDMAARIVAEGMNAEWSTPVFVDNRPGAGSTIGAAYVAAAQPDGYTLLLIGPGTHAVTSAMYPNLSYDAIKSFASVIQIAKGPYFVLVNATSGIKTMDELVQRARASARPISYASTGKGSGSHFVAESLSKAIGARLLHVPYAGAAPATLALLAGQVDFAISDMSAMTHMQSGKLRALAVTTPERLPLFRNIPTLAEAGVQGVSYTLSVGLVAPAGTPAGVIRKINATVERVLRKDEARRKLEALGFEPAPTTPEAFAASIASDVSRFSAFVEQAGLRLQQ
ncbi:tripartite tricarboxylate transporter substrate binding protein [Pigmentiphaga sp. YJ18]|uniref:Bug family tripartite tricarboxylate transporter substrate binding protein n=1 Tax=Pigmentiphaga sp. YJ18 TaxID=3134907 RepID=UPI00311558A1